MAQAVLEAVWSRDLDIADESVLHQLCGDLGLDSAAMKQVALSSQTLEAAQKHTGDAIALGLFGSPTYLLGDQIFFGQDRLDFLEEEIVRSKSGMALAS
jgi:2-hydroxychromene-2-carboxylate isomerase